MFNFWFDLRDPFCWGKTLHLRVLHHLAIRQEYTTERVKLEVMRDKMVEDMEKRGINPKVTRERATRHCVCVSSH